MRMTMMPMRLGTRLNCYFLAAMAVVLLGFSVALYAIAAKHLHRQADERLESSLNTLAAAAEIGPEGIEWEPQERSLSFGRRTFEGQFCWRVGDDRGARLDGSATGAIERTLARLGAGSGAARRLGSASDESGSEWRVMTRRLERPRSDGDDSRRVDPNPAKRDALVLGVAASMEGIRATLRNLALTLAALSLAVWTLALVTGRRLCRIALRPLTEMADAAHAIGGDDPGRRLPAPVTDDELGELGSAFNALLDRLGESLERQRRFTGDASHQLCTPLTALQGQVDLVLRQERSPDEYRRVLSLVRSKTRHLRQIVDGLLFLSRADAEARRPELERIVLDDWLPEFLEAWPNARRPDVVFQSDGATTQAVLVHPGLLGELLNNLLDNAAKYARPGTPITVRLVPHDDGLCVSVTDKGPGIDPADLPHVFDPFFRAEAARMRGTTGTGLGLSVATRIAAAFGARIVARSDSGSGTTFAVTIPVSDTVHSPIATSV
jgi:two-component system, OmpR family, sensor kinase